MPKAQTEHLNEVTWSVAVLAGQCAAAAVAAGPCGSYQETAVPCEICDWENFSGF